MADITDLSLSAELLLYVEHLFFYLVNVEIYSIIYYYC